MEDSSLGTAIKKDLRLMLWLQVLHISTEQIDNKYCLVGGNYTVLLYYSAALHYLMLHKQKLQFLYECFLVRYAIKQ